jgi:peptide/nickel transport system ATP-binding protein
MKEQTLLAVENLKKHFLIERRLGAKGNVYLKAVDGVSFELCRNEVLGIVGESGSGKSTVAYNIIGMYVPTSGRILFDSKPIGGKSEHRPLDIKRDIQIVFQDPSSSLNPRRSIGHVIERPLRVHRITPRRQIKERVLNLLRMVELSEDYLYKYPPQIGGGERQLVSIARALATNPKLVILDEPTSALDVSIQGKIINTLMHLKQRLSLSYLFITHDLSLMRNVADRVIIMYLGRICEIASTEDFFHNPAHPYTMMLLSSIPVISEEEEAIKPRKIAPRGEIPSPVDLPVGCRFSTRCTRAVGRCFECEPELQQIAHGHLVSCHLCTT